MTALDASALIAHFDENDAHHVAVGATLSARAADVFVISAVTLAESLIVQARAGMMDAAERVTADLGLRAIPVSGAWSDIAALTTLRAQTGLRMPECCVLHAAESAGARTLLTFDERLARVARRRGLDIP